MPGGGLRNPAGFLLKIETGKGAVMEKSPKYLKVMDWIRSEIERGTLKEGDRLNTEYELSEMFGVSRQTVRHAIGELENAHVVTRIQGSGTYVGSAEFGEKTAERGRSMNIAVISTYVDSYIFPKTIRGLEKELAKHGYSMQISFTNNNTDREHQILEDIIARDSIDGLIVEGSKSALPNPNLDYYRQLSERHIPIIFFNTSYPCLNLPCVSLDDSTVSRNAVRLLTAAGHEKIAGIFKLDDGQGHLRYAGYQEALKEAGLCADERAVCWFDSVDLIDFKKLEDYLFLRLEGCTAVECYNDEIAYQLTEACRRRKIKIPDDLSIVSIDNSDLAERASVPFTSFPHPMEELGKKAAERLVALINDPDADGSYMFDPQPVVRGSVKII